EWTNSCHILFVDGGGTGLVLPMATQIQQVIKAYGFNNEGEGEVTFYFSGVLKFARLVKMYETQDPEIAAISVKLGSLLLPPLSTPPIGGAIPASSQTILLWTALFFQKGHLQNVTVLSSSTCKPGIQLMIFSFSLR
uniref:Protein C10 n=1 Tax=Oncorhynchus mykiss TaxID=8022 RepID=A0A8C7PHP1_ONCMY